jgi:hypothetical protein
MLWWSLLLRTPNDHLMVERRMHPWITEQLVATRMAEREREAIERRCYPARHRKTSERTTTHPRPWLFRQVGKMLIAMGKCIAGPEAPTAVTPVSRT